MEMIKYVAYYRVSTQKQGQSGLGLEAQKEAVKQFTKNCSDCVISEFTEIESGKKNNRVQLQRAIEYATKNEAVLLIAKLDRLGRNLHFITQLQESKVKFICCDNPSANDTMISLLAVFAQHEAKAISERTKAALDAKKARLKAAGLPENWRTGTWNNEARQKGIATRKEMAESNPNTKKAKNYATILRASGKTFAEIAEILNSEGHLTARGKKFDKAIVKYLIEK